MIFNPPGRPNNTMAGPNAFNQKPPAPLGPQVQPNFGGTGGTAINPVDRGDGKGTPLGPQVQPNVPGTGGTAINPVDRGDVKAPPTMQYQPPAPGGAPQISPGRTALIRSVMARAGQPRGGMGNAPTPSASPQMPKPRMPIFKPPGG